jgi:plasmid stabilization system protein ParE
LLKTRKIYNKYYFPELDIQEIYKYVAINDAISRADRLIEKLEEKCGSLSDFASYGHITPELTRFSIYSYLKFIINPAELSTKL